MASMKAYLAEKYMTGPKADAILAKVGDKKKKKKRKEGEASTSTSTSTSSNWIKDDDAAIWNKEDKVEEEEDSTVGETPVVASDRRFKKRRKLDDGNGWTTVQEGFAQAAMREATPPPVEDEEPQVVSGLVTAAQLKAKTQSRRAEPTVTQEDVAMMQETVYRDPSGRKIDTKAEKAAAARLKREREEKEAQKMEWGKGVVQNDQADARRKELEKMRLNKGFRNKDDKDLNEELKGKELWNDPAAQFLTKKQSKGPRRPEYQGPPPPPNRFGIQPGYRWDGVDRGTGFEKKFFQAKNAKRREGAEAYSWSVDDM